ncbi:hypothetical protein [Paraburkholderia sp.]|uniref:hypothetical protein n=1 Tax=Paraburkholderia sp. TaxID=1926495 RepID=UPI0039E4FD65
MTSTEVCIDDTNEACKALCFDDELPAIATVVARDVNLHTEVMTFVHARLARRDRFELAAKRLRALVEQMDIEAVQVCAGDRSLNRLQ